MSYGSDAYGEGPYGGTTLAVAGRTQDAYDRLPEHYRDADEGLDYPLLRYLSTLLDQLAPVDELVERIDYDRDEGDTGSDLVDAQGANASWFPWLSQLLGVRIDGLDVEEQRYALRYPEWAHASTSALEKAAKRGLTGTQFIQLTPHYGGNPWVIGLGTKDSQTPTPDTFAKLQALAPTWGQLEALGSFSGASAPSVIGAAEVERPTGYRLVRYSAGA